MHIVSCVSQRSSLPPMLTSLKRGVGRGLAVLGAGAVLSSIALMTARWQAARVSDIDVMYTLQQHAQNPACSKTQTRPGAHVHTSHGIQQLVLSYMRARVCVCVRV